MQSSSKLLQSLPRTIYFWLPMLAISLGYSFLGRYGRIIYVNYINRDPPTRFSLLLIMMAIAGIWALPIGFGGIIGGLVAIVYTFATKGTNVGLVALIVAAATVWLGFQETDTERDADRDIIWQEWLALLVIAIAPLGLAEAVFRFTSEIMSGVIVGIISGAVTVIGVQIKASGLSRKQAWQMFTVLAIASLVIGFIYGIFTYRYFSPG
jgi:hypothetical protein